MKTIAIAIDEDMIALIDEVVRKSAQTTNRSRVIRAAVKDFVAKELQRDREAREREILRKHRARLEREARALISEQAKP
jgi:metal-responsive CopG/Arc/MetJ family transcriptional regulator